MSNVITIYKYKQIIFSALKEKQPCTKYDLSSEIVQHLGSCNPQLFDIALSQLLNTKQASNYYVGENSAPFYTRIDYVDPNDIHILYRDVIIGELLDGSVDSILMKSTCMLAFDGSYDKHIYSQVIGNLISNGVISSMYIDKSLDVYLYSIKSSS